MVIESSASKQTLCSAKKVTANGVPHELDTFPFYKLWRNRKKTVENLCQ